jgi:hypothetical protein
MEKKYQVFLSSTYTNLKDERQDVFRSILDFRTHSFRSGNISCVAAYGFLSIYEAEAVGGGVAEFLHLTELGRRMLIEVVAVRAAPVSEILISPPHT